MAFFDIDGRYDELHGVGSAISRREAVLVSLLLHALFTIFLLVAPDMPWFAAITAPDPIAPAPAPREQPLPFMMVEAAPRPVPPPERPRAASDMDRRAASPERAVNPTNDEPMSRGNSPEMLNGMPARPERPAAAPPEPEPSSSSGPAVPPAPAATVPAPRAATPPATGIGESLRNLDQLIKRERFDNPTGGPNADDPHISFDSKGIDFGPWLARFVAQVKRNWLIPYAAMTMKGRVVVTFNVHRSGRISDLKVVQGAEIGAFNTAAFQALVLSNPTLALPDGYPEEFCEFRVTFFYNERPR